MPLSLLKGLAEELRTPAIEEFEEDLDEGRDEVAEAIEQATDAELSQSDIKAILDDNNPDNQAADLGEGDEELQAIAADAMDEDLKAIEAMLDALAQ